MGGMVRSFGRELTLIFFGAALLWGAVLIVAPQLAMIDRSFQAPDRRLDSVVARTLARDAATCALVLKRFETPAGAAPSGGLAIPSLGGGSDSASKPAFGGLASPTIGTMGGAGGKLPYILQCDRATTGARLVRDPDAEPETLAGAYDLPMRAVDTSAAAARQIAQAAEVEAIAEAVHTRILALEADAPRWSGDNLRALIAARAIPMSPETRAIEDARLDKQLYSFVGLRFEADGVIHERLGLITLARTLFFAVLATALALVVCYPVAYNLALVASKQRAVWLFLGLLIPYATVELMRIYAWSTIIDNRGILNQLLDLLGVADLEAGSFVAFKRYPATVFVVMVYTYILFMALPLYSVMQTLDRGQIEAARDLGASTARIHRRVVIPHARPGIAVGCISTFMLSAGAFSVPRIISSGLQAEWFTQNIYNKFFESGNQNTGAAFALAFMAVCFAIVAVFMRLMRARLSDFVRA
jgi:ABC-type spermidine/putrescine transport system permease subunit I